MGSPSCRQTRMHLPTRRQHLSPGATRMTRARASEAIAVALAGIIGIGCFGYYRPITPDLAGRRVQLSLTDSGAVVLAPRLGNGIESVDGTLTADSAAQYAVSVLSTKRRDGQENDWRGEPVLIPHSLVS